MNGYMTHIAKQGERWVSEDKRSTASPLILKSWGKSQAMLGWESL